MFLEGVVKMMRILFISVISVFLIASILRSLAEVPDSVQIYSKGGKGIYKKVLGERETAIYETERDFIRKSGVIVSPDSKFIAIIETNRGVSSPETHDFSILPKNSLAIVDPEGKEIARLDEDVRMLCWSPDGEKIAYITGTYYEGGVGFKTTGVYVFDLEDGTKKQVTKAFSHPTIKDFKGGGYDINWAVHDSNIYIQEFEALGGNYMYNSKTGKTEKVLYKGIHFSSDGEYYLALCPEASPRLYVSSTNQEITDHVKSRLGYLPSGWIPDQKHHMLAIKVDYEPTPEDSISPTMPRAIIKGIRKVRQRTFFIYDVENDKIIKDWIEKP